uniref:Ubiquitin-like domain-containing protein n=1 Tax=Kalanchoe fedtschenkoi TaxID=63787 RepID=A0A7N0TF47_KALFE
MSSATVAIAPCPGGSLFSSEYINTHLGPSSDESIRVFLALSGSRLPFRLLPSDSIESVKLRIQTCKGFVMKNQKLICGGRELSRNDSLVRDYGVTDGNVLHLVLRLSDLQLINVTTTTGKEFTLHVEKCRDVAYVKQQLTKKGRAFQRAEEHKVMCNGEELEDQRIIDDICKNSNAVIHLLIRKTAKIATMAWSLLLLIPRFICFRELRI